MGHRTSTDDTVSSASISADTPISLTPSALPGQLLLGRYRVERVLGQGGMGTVVAARHVELGQLVAFKFLHAEALRRPEVVERFVREARAAAKLSSDHVARVSDVGRLDSGEPYMMMEHLTGRDLDQLLSEQGALRLEDVLRYVLQACDAVAEAHTLGIVHRDLKPANLFLHEAKNGRPVLKVLDFGISKELAPDSVRLTSTHAMLGSPLYMSPEQASQPQLVDVRSDIWALGVVMYELATGEPPFAGVSVPEVISKILDANPAPPSAVREGLPEWFDAIVQRCLRKTMADRFQSVGELALELEAAIKRLPIPELASVPREPLVVALATSPARATPLPKETASAPMTLPSIERAPRLHGRRPRARLGLLVLMLITTGALAAVALVVSRAGDAPTPETQSSLGATTVADSAASAPVDAPPIVSAAGTAAGPQIASSISSASTELATSTRSSAPALRRTSAPTSQPSGSKPHDPLDTLD